MMGVQLPDRKVFETAGDQGDASQHQRVGGGSSILQQPDIPALEIKLGALVVPLCTTAVHHSRLRAFVLVFSLSLHSVFEGLAVGLLENGGPGIPCGAPHPQEHCCLQPRFQTV